MTLFACLTIANIFMAAFCIVGMLGRFDPPKWTKLLGLWLLLFLVSCILFAGPASAMSAAENDAGANAMSEVAVAVITGDWDDDD